MRRRGPCEQVHNDRPVLSHVVEWNAKQASRQSRHNHHQAERLVEDDGLQNNESEQADQQRQTKLVAAEADHASQHSHSGAGDERQ